MKGRRDEGTKGQMDEGTTDPMSNAQNNVFVKRGTRDDGRRDPMIIV